MQGCIRGQRATRNQRVQRPAVLVCMGRCERVCITACGERFFFTRVCRVVNPGGAVQRTLAARYSVICVQARRVIWDRSRCAGYLGLITRCGRANPQIAGENVFSVDKGNNRSGNFTAVLPHSGVLWPPKKP